MKVSVCAGPQKKFLDKQGTVVRFGATVLHNF